MRSRLYPGVLRWPFLVLFAYTVVPFNVFGAPAGDIPAVEARQLVAQFMQTVSSLHAEFEQTVVDESGEVIEVERGELWLKRPGQFRWLYREPSEREIVADPETIWLYDADLDQVTIRSVEQAVAESPAALLVGDTSALNEYTFSGQRLPDGLVRVTLVPRKPNGDFKAIDIGFLNNELARLELADRFGQRTAIQFFAVERNPPITESIFAFVLPDGADVIDQRGP